MGLDKWIFRKGSILMACGDPWSDGSVNNLYNRAF